MEAGDANLVFRMIYKSLLLSTVRVVIASPNSRSPSLSSSPGPVPGLYPGVILTRLNCQVEPFLSAHSEVSGRFQAPKDPGDYESWTRTILVNLANQLDARNIPFGKAD